MCSDHSPVSCCFQMYKMSNEEDIPSTKVIINLKKRKKKQIDKSEITKRI
ncbi:hypothetical protein [Plasmodium yoelii yoelii]|nr:hypothetical protein [Plasmodium yoelii yoelii]